MLTKIKTGPTTELSFVWGTQCIPTEVITKALTHLNMTLKDLQNFTCAKEALRLYIQKEYKCRLTPIYFQVVHTWLNILVQVDAKHEQIENVAPHNRKIHFCAMKLFLRDVTSKDISWFVQQANSKAPNSIEHLDTNYFELVEELAIYENTEFVTGRAALNRKVATENLRMSSKLLDALFEALNHVYKRKYVFIFMKDRSLQDRDIREFLTKDIPIGTHFIPDVWPT